MKTYTVRARRVGAWWALDVPDAPGVHTQVKRLDQAESMARDAIGVVLDISPATFEVVVLPMIPEPMREIVEEATAARSTAAQAQETAARLTRQAARQLVEEGLTVRDAGVLLGVSHQRIAQLLQAG
jgi:predicted RNase H-like HicB family nuclease